MLHWISLLCAGCLEMAGVALMNQYAKEKSVKWVLLIIVGLPLHFPCCRTQWKPLRWERLTRSGQELAPPAGRLSASSFTRSRKTPNGSSLSR